MASETSVVTPERFASGLATFGEWKRSQPGSTVVTFDTGYDRPYEKELYGDYFESDRLIFPVSHVDRRLGPKTPVVGILYGDDVRAYPAGVIRAAPGGVVRDDVGGRAVVLEAWDDGIRVVEAPPDARVVHTFWFAWAAFHPRTEVYGQ